MENNRFEIIPEEDGLLQKYEKTFLKKQRVLQECEQLKVRYMRLFGTLLIQRYDLQVQSIRRRKEIALYLQAYNRGEKPDPEAIEKELDRIMKAYDGELENLIAKHVLSQGAVPVTEEEKLRIRRIFRELVHLMHPDLHPGLADNEMIQDLWNQLNAAYQVMDLDAMEGIRVQVIAVLSGLPDAGVIPTVDKLKERIQKLESEIEVIQSQDPYRYKEWIFDRELVQEKKDELHEQIEDLKDYNEQLKENLEHIIAARENNTCMN